MKSFTQQFIGRFVLTSVFILTSVLLPNLALAQSSTTPVRGIPTGTPTTPPASTAPKSSAAGLVPCGNTADDPCTLADLFSGVVGVINILIAFAGVLAVMVIVYAGFRMVWSRGNESEYKAARGLLNGAIIGLIIVSAAFAIVSGAFRGFFATTGLIKDGDKVFTPGQFINPNSGTTPAPSTPPTPKP